MLTDKEGVFDVDEANLVKAWGEQPRLYHQHAIKLAEAKRDHERAKADLDVVEAELYQEARADPGSFGLPTDKAATETAVKNAIALQKRSKRAVNAVLEAKHAVDVHAAMVDALDHRKKLLENLVHLASMDWFSSPRAKGDAGKVFAEADKQDVRRRGKKGA